jgi:hypothetical protein
MFVCIRSLRVNFDLATTLATRADYRPTLCAYLQLHPLLSLHLRDQTYIKFVCQNGVFVAQKAKEGRVDHTRWTCQSANVRVYFSLGLLPVTDSCLIQCNKCAQTRYRGGSCGASRHT